MKIRYGFVSNSSSTSFCIYGVSLENEDEEIVDAAGKLGLYVQYGQWDGVYIGREYSSIKNDETGAEFKESTQKLIDQLPIQDKHCSTQEGGWYDG